MARNSSWDNGGSREGEQLHEFQGSGAAILVASADLDGGVLRAEPSHCRHAFVAGGQRVRAQDIHLAALRDVVPQVFELNGRLDVPVRPDRGRAFTTGRDL